MLVLGPLQVWLNCNRNLRLTASLYFLIHYTKSCRKADSCQSMLTTNSLEATISLKNLRINLQVLQYGFAALISAKEAEKEPKKPAPFENSEKATKPHRGENESFYQH